jgi:hypothetical protein
LESDVLDNLLKSNIAIVGGGNFCKKLLQLMFSEPFEDCHPTILGVADVDNQAEGRVLAEQMGIFTTAQRSAGNNGADRRCGIRGFHQQRKTNRR